jgi:ADP-ribose pyrophosphatase YjhB (NUDIX family)
MNQAALSYIERLDGHILCVWNKRYNGWALPGGKVEEGESPAATQERELREETGLETISSELLYEHEHDSLGPAGGKRHVYVFRVKPAGIPTMMEPGCPTAWLDREELLLRTPFKVYFDEFFQFLDAQRAVE